MCWMDVNGKLTFISQTIYELKHAQKQIWRRLTSDLNNSSEDSVKRLEDLDEHVYKLEAQCDKQYRKLKEITQLVLLLLEKVTIFNNAVETFQDRTDSTNRRVASENFECVSSELTNNKSDGYCMLNKHKDSRVSGTTTTNSNEDAKQETTVEGQLPTSSVDNLTNDVSSTFQVKKDVETLNQITDNVSSYDVKEDSGSLLCNTSVDIKGTKESATAKRTCSNIACDVTSSSIPKCNITIFENDTPMEAERHNATTQEAQRDNVTSQETRRNNVTSQKTRRNNVTSRKARRNNVTSQQTRLNIVSSQETRRNHVTSQETRRNNVTSQEARRNNIASQEAQQHSVTTQEAQGNNVASQEAEQNNVTSQEERRNNVTSQETKRNNVASKEAEQNNVTSQETQQNNVPSQKAQGNNISSHKSQGNNVTSQETRRNNVTSHEPQGNKVTSQEAQRNNVASQEAQRNNVTSQEAQEDNVPSQDAQGNKVTSQEAQGNNVTSQETHRYNVTSHKPQGNNVTSQKQVTDHNISNLGETVSKNNFGYKQKRSDMTVDNRVTFHSKLEPYKGISQNVEDSFNVSLDGEGISDQPLPKPNITPRKRLADLQQQSNNPFHEFDDDHFNNDTYFTEQPRNLIEWKRYAEQIRIHSLTKVKSGRIKRGRHGHDVILVLDISKRMEGSKFESMINTALQYVEGIQHIHRSSGLEDNIGLATFGGQTRLVHESTSDYDLIKGLICDLLPRGEAPLVAGMLMGLAGVSGGATSQILDNTVPGHMIIFTDGTSGDTVPGFENGLGVDPSYFTGDFLGHCADTSGVVKMIASHSIKIFYVPIAEPEQNIPLEKAVRQTNGKIIQPTEIFRLIKLTQVMLLAARVAAEMRFSGASDATESIKWHIMQKTPNVQDTNDDCVEMVREFINPLSAEIRKGMYVELKCYSLQLGDRVRRGPSWKYGDQDSNMAGTVVGQDIEGSIWVEWDNGYSNMYLYNESLNAYTIQKVNEPRIRVGELIAVGCRVVRGQEWIFEDYDGGIGSLGTVLNVREDGTVVVRWDCKSTGLYKCGYNGLFEIQVCEDCEMAETTQYVDPKNQMFAEYSQPNSYQQEKIQSENNTNVNNTTGNYGNNTPLYSGTTYMAVWEYKGKNSTWTNYPPEINEHIEKAYQKKPEGRTIIKITQESHVVDFRDMIQENPMDKTKIQIRRRP